MSKQIREFKVSRTLLRSYLTFEVEKERVVRAYAIKATLREHFRQYRVYVSYGVLRIKLQDHMGNIVLDEEYDLEEKECFLWNDVFRFLEGKIDMAIRYSEIVEANQELAFA